ncbi:MAG: 2-dehydropantoate 2-reductase [Chloroflexi bacterium]|nr:2-dehydropantoate 2-reductase [Chloroflexota bacterium]MCA2002007.1 2-dehydropantoate 2-reductase [Chloroflexota bacterium]
MNENSILLVGTGALATLFAARLSAAGHSVSMLGTWKGGLEALRENGARIVDSDGHERAYQVHATDDPLDVHGAKFAIVLVKSWQTERAARQLKLALADDGLALTLQNGLGNRETLARQLGFERVSLGVTTTGATLLGPGLARIGGEGVVSIEQNEALSPLKAALKSSNFNVQVVDDAQSLIWGKLVINAAINPLTALLRVPNGELLASPLTRKIMASLARETAEVAAAEHVRLPFSNPVSAAEDVARKTAQNISSMFQDVRRGAPTEIDAICGAVTQRAEIHGIKTPYNRACWQLVKAL